MAAAAAWRQALMGRAGAAAGAQPATSPAGPALVALFSPWPGRPSFSGAGHLHTRQRAATNGCSRDEGAGPQRSRAWGPPTALARALCRGCVAPAPAAAGQRPPAGRGLPEHPFLMPSRLSSSCTCLPVPLLSLGLRHRLDQQFLLFLAQCKQPCCSSPVQVHVNTFRQSSAQWLRASCYDTLQARRNTKASTRLSQMHAL